MQPYQVSHILDVITGKDFSYLIRGENLSLSLQGTTPLSSTPYQIHILQPCYFNIKRLTLPALQHCNYPIRVFIRSVRDLIFFASAMYSVALDKATCVKMSSGTFLTTPLCYVSLAPSFRSRTARFCRLLTIHHCVEDKIGAWGEIAMLGI